MKETAWLEQREREYIYVFMRTVLLYDVFKCNRYAYNMRKDNYRYSTTKNYTLNPFLLDKRKQREAINA